MKRTEAYDLGYERGTSAGSWYFDGNTSDDTYAVVLQGIEEGDPKITDTMPSFTFGEWAGESCAEVFYDWARMSESEQDDATEHYLSGFYDGSVDEIERIARYHVEEIPF
jgi:hypothetical protein